MLNIDPNSVDVTKLTSNQVRQLFTSVVQQIQDDTGADFTSAWAQAKIACPALADAMAQRNTDMGSVVDAAPPLPKPSMPPPLATELNTYNLGLPPNVDGDVFCQAWKLNGGKASPLDAGKVYDGLVDFLQDKGYGTRDEAEAVAAVRFPRLKILKYSQAAAAELAKSNPATSTPSNVPATLPPVAPPQQVSMGLTNANPNPFRPKPDAVGNEAEGFVMDSGPLTVANDTATTFKARGTAKQLADFCALLPAIAKQHGIELQP